MNAAITQYDGHEFDYRVEFRAMRGSSGGPPSTAAKNAPRFRRRRNGGQPVQFNEIRRRRTKKIRW